MIEYKFQGRVSNNRILKYYHDTPVDCFVMTSEHEGLPVSIMEAESAGIPIVATNVGGISEMIDGNGFILPSNPTPEEIADAIIACLNCSAETKTNRRKCSRDIWENKFDATKNARNFVKNTIEKNMEGKQRVIFLTEGYPYIESEKSFLETELIEILRHYDVTIIARIDGKYKDIDTNVAEKNISELKRRSDSDKKINVFRYDEHWNIKSLPKIILEYAFDRRINYEKKEILLGKEKLFIRYWESIKYYGKAMSFNRWISKSKIPELNLDNTLVYSYWNVQPVLGICINRSRFKNNRIISRAHGYDYQDERWPKTNRKPFMETIDQMTDSIVFVSEAGKNYHLKRHAKCDYSKYVVSYLGSNNAFDGGLEDFNDAYWGEENKVYRVASCASMIPLKRINLVIDALKKVSEKNDLIRIEWVHFGDGPLREELEQKAKAVLG